MSLQVMPCGRPTGGNPPCTAPTIATPCEDASSTADRMIDRTTATTAPGTFGRNRLKPRMRISAPAAKATVQPLASPRWVIVDHCCSNQLPVPFGMPEHVGDLTGEHLDADSGQEAHQDARAEEVAEEPELEQPRQEEQAAADQGDQAGPRHPLGRVRLQARRCPHRRARPPGWPPSRSRHPPRADATSRGGRTAASGRSPCTGR